MINVGFFGSKAKREFLGFKPPRADENQVYVYLDEDVQNDLIQDLQALRARSRTDHIHYFSTDWGDGELDAAVVGDVFRPAHHLKIMLA